MSGIIEPACIMIFVVNADWMMDKQESGQIMTYMNKSTGFIWKILLKIVIQLKLKFEC